MVQLEFTDDRLVNTDQNISIDFSAVNTDWLSSTIYYVNILVYLIYCSFIATMRFGSLYFSNTVNMCLEGSLYEMQMAS